MRIFIVTTIIALAAAQAKAQAKDKLNNQKVRKKQDRREQPDPERVPVICDSVDSDLQSSRRSANRQRFPDGANPVFT